MSDNKILAKRIAELERQLTTANSNNQALVAHVKKITQKIFATYHNQINIDTADKLGVRDVFCDIGELFELAKATPQHHLRELQAEAVLNAVNFGRNQTKYFLRSSEDILQQIEQYADSILQEVK